MSCGLPVIAPKVGDWGEMIETEDCGITLEDDTTENYLTALEELRDKRIWARKSRNAINTIENKFNWTQVLSPIRDALQTISKP